MEQVARTCHDLTQNCHDCNAYLLPKVENLRKEELLACVCMVEDLLRKEDILMPTFGDRVCAEICAEIKATIKRAQVSALDIIMEKQQKHVIEGPRYEKKLLSQEEREKREEEEWKARQSAILLRQEEKEKREDEWKARQLAIFEANSTIVHICPTNHM